MKEKRPHEIQSSTLDHFMLGFVVSSFKFSELREGTCNTLNFMQVRRAHRFIVHRWSSSYLSKVCTKLLTGRGGGGGVKQQQNKLRRSSEGFLPNFELKLSQDQTVSQPFYTDKGRCLKESRSPSDSTAVRRSVRFACPTEARPKVVPAPGFPAPLYSPSTCCSTPPYLCWSFTYRCFCPYIL